MSWIDEQGVEHVSMSDPVSAWGDSHIACCPRCAVMLGATWTRTLPIAASGAEAEAMLDAGAEAVVVARRNP